MIMSKGPPLLPPIGNDAEQMARIRHLVERHGWRLLAHDSCHGNGCPACDDAGAFLTIGDETPCGPACRLHDLAEN